MTRTAKLAAAGTLLLATLAAYGPALGGGFLWDDDAHVTQPDLRSLAGLARIWIDPSATQQYYPLTHSAFWLQWWLWGESTTGYHVVNVVLHVLSALLVWAILDRLKVPGGAAVAAVFALHPVHVESVAWITELKNTLSGVLYLGAMLAYLRFDPPDAPDDARRSWVRYAAASVLFAGALLSKTVTATLPAALLVIYWWKQGRVSWERHAAPLAPWLGLGAAMGLITAWIERTVIGATGEAFDLTLWERVLLAGRVFWFYLGKLLWPMDLIFIYPRWEVESWPVAAVAWPLAAVALLAAFWSMREHVGRGPAAAVMFFGGTLFPVLGFFNVYPFKFSYVADHFQYLASLGILTLVVAGTAARVAQVGGTARNVGSVACGIGVVAMAMLTWVQCGIYRDAETLWLDTTTRSPRSFMAFNNLGYEYSRQERLDEAEQAYRRAIEVKPDFAQAHFNLGRLHGRRGEHDRAVELYGRALEHDPGFAQAHYNLGLEYGALGRHAEALVSFEAAVETDPTFPEAHYNLGSALGRLGRYAEAVPAFEAALELKPDYPEAWLNLGVALAAIERHDEAAEAYHEALALRGDYLEAWHNLALAERRAGRPEAAMLARLRAGTILGQRGRYAEAADQLRAALAIEPASAETRYKLGAALARLGRHDEARAEWEEVLRLDPEGEHGRLARESIASLDRATAAASP